MMNHTMFKAVREDNGELVKGYLWRGADSCYIIPHNLGVDYNLATNRMTAVAYRVLPETIEQSTTVCDKSGTVIYSGDRVKTKQFGQDNGRGVNFNDYDIFTIVFKDGQFLLENDTRRFTLTASVSAKLEIVKEDENGTNSSI